jgi:hypothetical protein
VFRSIAPIGSPVERPVGPQMALGSLGTLPEGASTTEPQVCTPKMSTMRYRRGTRGNAVVGA